MLTGYPPDDRFQARQTTAVARAYAPAAVFCCGVGGGERITVNGFGERIAVNGFGERIERIREVAWCGWRCDVGRGSRDNANLSGGDW
jgi:hypothetical protein